MSNQLRPMPAASHFRLNVSPGNAAEFDLWRWSVTPMFTFDAASREARPHFSMQADSFHFADMACAQTTSAASRFERDNAVVARAGLDNIIVQVYHSGGYRFDADGRSVEVRSGDIAVIDLTRRSVISATDYTQSSLVLPRASLERLIPNLDDVHGLVIPRGTALNALLISHMRSMHAEAGGFTIAEARAAVNGTAALVAACVGPSMDAREIAVSAVSVVSLQMLRRAIEASLGRADLGPDVLAEAFGVSRAKLYRLFAPLGGVRAYIQQQRLKRAYRALSGRSQDNERLGMIARQCGFSSDTVFSRSFRETFGLSPREVREAARAGRMEAAGSSVADDDAFHSMHRWIVGVDAIGREGLLRDNSAVSFIQTQ